MNSTRKIREQLDLTQNELASFLGITRSHLAQVEISRRELPTAALIKLGALQISLHNNVHYNPQHPLLQAGKDLALMQRHAKTCQYMARLQKRKLEKLEARYQHCLLALMTIDHLRNNLPAAAKNRQDQLWLDMIQAQTVKKLRGCGPAAQVKIKLTVQALEMQAERAEAMKF